MDNLIFDEIIILSRKELNFETFFYSSEDEDEEKISLLNEFLLI